MEKGAKQNMWSKLTINVYDMRKKSTQHEENAIEIADCSCFCDFYSRIFEHFEIPEKSNSILCTTSRIELTEENYACVEDGETLYLMDNKEAELAEPVKQPIQFQPHYDTIIKGGLYEYYASEGQNPLPFAFAELIDNAISATSSNRGLRTIDIILYLDGEPTVVVTDNGRGMSAKALNDWAIYRLSKFNRRSSNFDTTTNVSMSCSPETGEVQQPRCLSSDISYFGVGGKQAIFFIGSYTKVITKSQQSPDVHELEMSQEAFEAKERNRDSIYSGFIVNRKACDSSHVDAEDALQQKLIGEEKNKESFTTIVIRQLNTSYLPYLRQQLRQCCKQLAHIYHYYLHGPVGNRPTDEQQPSADAILNIAVTVYDKAGRPPRVFNLRDIDSDVETQFVRSAASTFEFKAAVDGGRIEGILRYHPFLYDHETFPADSFGVKDTDPMEDHDYATNDDKPARGKRPIFECYWNGRLIPYTSITEFDWCAIPKRGRSLPLECYNRVSGALFTDHMFQVSTNKLTFMDLEMKMKSKDIVYTLVVDKTERRVDIHREFHNWLKMCHETFDKQIKFSDFKGTIKRDNLPKKVQFPWSVYEQIEWDGKIFKKGTLVHVQKTTPAIHGTVEKFLLFGDCGDEVFATGGEMVIRQEPKYLHKETSNFALSKLDRTMSSEQVKKVLEEEDTRLPSEIRVTWPENNSVSSGDKITVGTAIGPLEVRILNKANEEMSRLPGTRKKLLTELKLIYHSARGDDVIAHHISQHGGPAWPYWFYKMANINNVGNYTLLLQVITNDTDSHKFAGRLLPLLSIKFTATVGPAEKFTIGMLEGPFCVGAPFSIPLDFQDCFGHSAPPPAGIVPTLNCSGLKLTYENTVTKDNSLIVKDIVAMGTVPAGGKSFSLEIALSPLKESSQQMNFRLLAGSPTKLVVKSDVSDVVENGSVLTFEVEVQDAAGNISTQSKLTVTCRFVSDNGSEDPVSIQPVYKVDCSGSGHGVLTGPPFWLNKIKDTQKVKAIIELADVKGVPCVERTFTVTPSHQPSCITLSYDRADGSGRQTVKEGQEIEAPAGEYLSSLKFEVTDESSDVISNIGHFVDRLKINWAAGRLARDQLMAGKLPDIRIPSLAGETKYCNVSLHISAGIEFGFTVRAVPGAPHQIKCKCTGAAKVRMGEVLLADIQVLVQDRFGNNLSKFEKGVLKDLLIESEGLAVEQTCRMLGPVSGFNISGVRFTSGPVGSREVKVTWRSLVDCVKLEVTAGPPTTLTLPGWDLTDPVTVINGSTLPQDLVCQLCDNQGNAACESDVKISLIRDSPHLKLIPAVQPLQTDATGSVNFGKFALAAKAGLYVLTVKAFVTRHTLTAPPFRLLVVPDRQRPKELAVKYTLSPPYIAGNYFPDFAVSVLAEDAQPVTETQTDQRCMLLKVARVTISGLEGPVKTLSPDHKHTDDGTYLFTKRTLPTVAGQYSLVFVYSDTYAGQAFELTSNEIVLDVDAGQPVKLCPVQPLATPTVTNESDPSCRTIISHLVLQLQDEYNNATGQSIAGLMVELVIVCADATVADVPKFAGDVSVVTIPAIRGQLVLSDIQLAANCTGRDSQEYVLRCTATARQHIGNLTYDIPFIFCNSVKRMVQIASLTKERDGLKSALSAYKNIFDTSSQLVAELRSSVSKAHHQVVRQKAKLPNFGVNGVESLTISSLDKLINTRREEKEQMEAAPRRTCGLSKAPADPEVLGKVVHLATVEDDSVARVLSWHMADDMDCIVTRTSKKAKELYDKSNGRQQVLPLDSIFTKRLPEWDKPLIHKMLNLNFVPTGNPTYARWLLHFDTNVDECKLVFGMLLGDTLVVDTLDDANTYRQEIVKKSHCPTILTRTGDRVKSIGKFGGTSNRAVSWDRLAGSYFSAPVPALYLETCSAIEHLSALRSAMVQEQQLKEELEAEVAKQATPETQAQHDAYRQTERRLTEIEAKLGMTPVASRPHAQQHSPPKRAVGRPRKLKDMGEMAVSTATTLINAQIPNEQDVDIADWSDFEIAEGHQAAAIPIPVLSADSLKPVNHQPMGRGRKRSAEVVADKQAVWTPTRSGRQVQPTAKAASYSLVKQRKTSH